MCSTQFKREYIKAKERGRAIGDKLKMNEKCQHFDRLSMDYLTVNNGYNLEENGLNGKYRKKGKYITKFAKEIGVDIDEMALYLERNMGDGLWEKLTNNKDVLRKEKSVQKLLNEICVKTIKDKRMKQNGYKNGIDFDYDEEKPRREAIQQLNFRIVNLLRENNEDKIRLDKDEFENNFCDYLYEIHQQIVNRRMSD